MKYRKEVQQHATFLPTSSIPCSTADIGIADEIFFFRLIRNHLSPVSCLFLTLGEVGEVRGIFKCNYSKQFGKLLSYDRHRFRLCSCLNHQEATQGPRLWLLKLINLCMAWLLRINLYENSRCRGVLKTPPVGGGNDCKCNESFSLALQRLIGRFRWCFVRAAYM